MLERVRILILGNLTQDKRKDNHRGLLDLGDAGGPAFKPGGLFEEGQSDRVNRAISLLGNDQIRLATIVIRRMVDLLTKKEQNHISILFNRPGLS